jgi:hypothetical protein
MVMWVVWAVARQRLSGRKEVAAAQAGAASKASKAARPAGKAAAPVKEKITADDARERYLARKAAAKAATGKK